MQRTRLPRLSGGLSGAAARAADLRFTPDEAAAYFNQVMGLDLSAREVATLVGRTARSAHYFVPGGPRRLTLLTRPNPAPCHPWGLDLEVVENPSCWNVLKVFVGERGLALNRPRTSPGGD
jgi:hypothetical protein